MDKRVGIFFCGAQKGGTTSLDAYFREHADLSAPVRKELHFFDDESRNWKSPDYLALNESFDQNDGLKSRYDATPIYGFWPPSLARIKAYNPEAKLIFLFRDPFDRAWSQWCMEYARNAETLTFGEAIRSGRRRMDGLSEYAQERRVYTYVERGLYSAQVCRALGLFPRHQMLFLRSEDLLNDHTEALAKLARFLDIRPFAECESKQEHQRPAINYPAMPTEADRFHVAQQVGEDMREFSALTGLDISGWQTYRALLEYSATHEIFETGNTNR